MGGKTELSNNRVKWLHRHNGFLLYSQRISFGIYVVGWGRLRMWWESIALTLNRYNSHTNCYVSCLWAKNNFWEFGRSHGITRMWTLNGIDLVALLSSTTAATEQQQHLIMLNAFGCKRQLILFFFA